MTKLRSTLLIGSLVLGLGVTHSGIAFAAFDSFGSEIPLESAAKQIVPEGYKVDYGSGVDKSTAISWGSAKDWQSALASAVSKKGLRAEIGSDTVVIVKGGATEAASRPYSSTPSKEIVQKKPTSSHKSGNTKPRQRQDRVEPVAPREEAAVGGGGFTIRPYHGSADPAKAGQGLKGKDFADSKSGDGWKKHEGKGQFVVEEGYMLHGTLDAWAEATGWKVVWDSGSDYIIDASATFSGDFVEASSALITAMSDARPQITVDYYEGNKVIVISNKLSDEVNH